MSGVDIFEKLNKHRAKKERHADEVLQEVNRILNKSAFSEKNVLQHLKSYNLLTEVIEEADVDPAFVFSLSEIKEIALSYRLRFVDSQCYRYDFPYSSVLKIEHFNLVYKKTLKGFKILSTEGFFKKEDCKDAVLLFVPTNLGNFYLIDRWGEQLAWHRKLTSWPLKNIENLFATLLVVTLIITLSLPTYLITLDRKATYWCAYRIGIFFHLLIFNMGFTAYFTFAFSRNLGAAVWNSEQGLN